MWSEAFGSEVAAEVCRSAYMINVCKCNLPECSKATLTGVLICNQGPSCLYACHFGLAYSSYMRLLGAVSPWLTMGGSCACSCLLDSRVSLSAAPDVVALNQGGPTGCCGMNVGALECMLGYWGGCFDWQSLCACGCKDDVVWVCKCALCTTTYCFATCRGFAMLQLKPPLGCFASCALVLLACIRV